MRLRAAGVLFCASLAAASSRDRISYPPAAKGDVVQDYFGTKVADPYRWLEEADASATVKWVDAENALTRSFVDGPARDAMKKRLAQLLDFPRISAPEKHGAYYFHRRNAGLQNQSVLLVREGLGGTDRILLDPNTLSEDGTLSLAGTIYTKDGSLMLYGLSQSGSDRSVLHVRDVKTGEDRADTIRWGKWVQAAWLPDNSGFYYTRFPEPGRVPAGDENYFAKIYFHSLGDAQDKDVLVFDSPDRKDIIWNPDLTEDGQYLVITGFQGASDKTEVLVLDRSQEGAKPALLFQGFRDSNAYIGNVGRRLFFTTDRSAPLGRVIAVDMAGTSREAVPVLAEGTEKLDEAHIVHGQLVVLRLKNASSQVAVHSLDGALVKSLDLPTLGTVSGLTGEPEDDEMFFSFASFTYPPTAYRYDFKAGRLAVFEKPEVTFDTTAFEAKQVWYPSKDGTKISLFIVHRKGLPLDGARPTLLDGYGGFNVSLTPAFSATRVLWLERGGVYAMANLRGGGEYGEAWHQAGMLERKQNVFDDFIAASEWLVKNGYTRRDRLAILGGSNGGLLVGAALTQRPDLFGAVICQVPVADMLRYHLFTVGRFWIPEYGSADDPKQFPYLLRYSPYHNVKEKTAYPATLVTTADTDDRVSPGMAKKFAARLQAATAGDAPILIRIETKAGHGGGKPISKQIDEQADIYSFLTKVLKVEAPPAMKAKAAVSN
jgi:prolyl oligopeptidase